MKKKILERGIFEPINGAKFDSLTHTQMWNINGGAAGDTSGGKEQAGNPIWHDATETNPAYFEIRFRAWDSDKVDGGGGTCFVNEHFIVINTAR